VGAGGRTPVGVSQEKRAPVAGSWVATHGTAPAMVVTGAAMINS